MPTEKPFFKHDLNARNDKKMLLLANAHKSSGNGIFWTFLEILYFEEGEVDFDDDTFLMVATPLFETVEKVRTVIEDCIRKFKLFTEKEGKISSTRATDAIYKMKFISQVRSESAGKRGKNKTEPKEKKKPAKSDEKAFAEQLLSKSNAKAEQLLSKSSAFASKILQEDKEEDKEENTNTDKNKEHEKFSSLDPETEIQNPDGRRGVEHSVERSPGELKSFGTGVVIYNAEADILKNEIVFQQLCTTTNTEADVAREVLHELHLWLETKEKYPIGRKAAYAHFERFLNNKQFHRNGTNIPDSSGRIPKGSRGKGRLNGLSKFVDG